AHVRTLIVDDDPAYGPLVAARLRDAGHSVDVERSGVAALVRLKAESYDVLLLDLAMPGLTGLDFIPRLDPANRPEVVIVSHAISVREAVAATKLGAFECITKSETPDALEVVVRRAAEARRRKRDLELATRNARSATPVPEFIARSPRIVQILEVLRDVAA